MNTLALIDKKQYIFDPVKGIWSIHFKKFLEGLISKNGYKKVSLNCVDGVKRRYYYHRVMAFMFIPNPEDKKFVDHINGNRLDNRVENLRWCTQKENNNFEPYRKAQVNNAKKSAIVYQYNIEGSLVKLWPSLHECERKGFSRWSISNCCNGLYKTYKGYKWSFKPL